MILMILIFKVTRKVYWQVKKCQVYHKLGRLSKTPIKSIDFYSHFIILITINSIFLVFYISILNFEFLNFES